MRATRATASLAAFWALLEFVACLWASIDISGRIKPFVDFWWALSIITGLPLGIVAIVMIRRLERRAWFRPRHVIPATQSCVLVATFAPVVLFFAAFSAELYACTPGSYQLGFLSEWSFLMLLVTYFGVLLGFFLLDRTRQQQIQDLLTVVHGPESVEMRVSDAVSAMLIADAAAEVSHND
jgi:hypothetical protein